MTIDHVLTELAGFGTPSIANALESLGQDPTVGFSDGSLRLLTESRPFVGRAITATMVSRAPRATDEAMVATEEYWRYVAGQPGPTIVVVQDLDPEPMGAMFGEVQGRLHRSLGVTGIVTNGAARDLGELSGIGLPVIAAYPCVSHAYARFREIDVPVTVGGLQIRPGDLLHADRHGVQVIPAEVRLEDLALVARNIEALESELFVAADANRGLDSFLSVWTGVRRRWPSVELQADQAI